MQHRLSEVDPFVRWRFRALLVATVLATYQLYLIPAAGTFFPVSLVAAYACLLFLRFRADDVRLLIWVALYFAVVLSSGLWSPDKGAWATAVLYGFLVFLAFFVAQSFNDSRALKVIVFWFLVFASLNAVLVVVFRVSPSLEDVYLGSDLRGYFKNPKLLANIELFRPNVYDVDKAGGIFDNANSGAAFSLLCVGASIATFGIYGRLLSIYMIIVFSAAVIFSGSKSALMIFLSSFAVIGLRGITSVRNPHLRVVSLCAGLLLAIAAIGVLLTVGTALESSEFGKDVEKTSEERWMLWRVARLTFFENPVRGLGFGGWGVVLARYAATGVNVFLPPHNSLIMAWTESGIFAVIFSVVIFLMFVRRLLLAIRRTNARVDAVGALFALVCVSGMSMGDTFALFGNASMAVPLGVLLSLGTAGLASSEGHARETRPRNGFEPGLRTNMRVATRLIDE